MALHHIEIVVLVEGDVERLVEHAVPLGVVPVRILAADAKGADHIAIGIELEDHVQEAVAHPDIAVAVHAQGVRVHGDVGIEDAQLLGAGGIILHHHDGGVAVEHQKVAVGAQRHGRNIAELLAIGARDLITEVIGQLRRGGDRDRAGRFGLLLGGGLRPGGGRQQQAGGDDCDFLHDGSSLKFSNGQCLWTSRHRASAARWRTG